MSLTPEQVLTVASILEYEANRSEDYPKVARVLYNRLDEGMPLQLDSTVSYVSQRSGDVWTTADERAEPSAYNTYAHRPAPRADRLPRRGDHRGGAGTPPRVTGCTSCPTTRPDTTRFSATYEEHNKWVAKLRRLLPRERGLLSDAAPGRRCAVVGSPIAHSLSPALHRAAYAELGLDWTYDPVEVDSAGLGASSTGSTPPGAGCP